MNVPTCIPPSELDVQNRLSARLRKRGEEEGGRTNSFMEPTSDGLALGFCQHLKPQDARSVVHIRPVAFTPSATTDPQTWGIRMALSLLSPPPGSTPMPARRYHLPCEVSSLQAFGHVLVLELSVARETAVECHACIPGDQNRRSLSRQI